jgi:NADPH:quinone reductase-like Zn-dependent oxidoreductase
MKVFEFRGQWSMDGLKIGERPTPEPGPGQILLRMKAASLNWRDRIVPLRGFGSKTGTLPLIPVSDGLGEVVALGEGVTRVKVGDRVCPTMMPHWISGYPDEGRLAQRRGGPLDGVMAEWMAADQEAVVKVPGTLSDEAAATLPCAALTAWSALITEGHIQPGDKVLIQGTGGVSLFALQFAKMAGAHVILLSSSDEKLARGIEMGADEGINYKKVPEWGREVRKLAGGIGVDHVVEVGGEATLAQSLKAVRTAGTLSVIGVLSGLNIAASLGMIVTRQIRMQGITVGSRDGFEAMVRAIDKASMQPQVDRVFAFEELPRALDYLGQGAHFGKTCIRIP